MEWILIIIGGVFLGTLVSFITQTESIRMPTSLAMAIGAFGALAGGAMDRIVGFYQTWGPWTFYAGAAILSLGFLAGSILARALTNEETRV